MSLFIKPGVRIPSAELARLYSGTEGNDDAKEALGSIFPEVGGRPHFEGTDWVLHNKLASEIELGHIQIVDEAKRSEIEVVTHIFELTHTFPWVQSVIMNRNKAFVTPYRLAEQIRTHMFGVTFYPYGLSPVECQELHRVVANDVDHFYHIASNALEAVEANTANQ